MAVGQWSLRIAQHTGWVAADTEEVSRPIRTAGRSGGEERWALHKQDFSVLAGVGRHGRPPV